MIVVPPTAEGLARAAEAVGGGEAVAYPTETVYGLGVDPFSESALARLFAVKRRSQGQAVLVIIAEPGQAREVAESVSPRAAACIEAFWPGALSLVLPRSRRVPDQLTGGRQTVCVRCPASDIARDLCRSVGGPVTSTSANVSGESPARSLADITLAGVAIGVDGGTLAPSAPSTVFDPERGEILREGVISREEIDKVLKRRS